MDELFEKLRFSLETARKEAQDFVGGKKAACGRLRKEAQVSKKIWQEIRLDAMARLKEMPTKKREKK